MNANPISLAGRDFCPFQRDCQLSRCRDGHGEPLSGQRRRDHLPCRGQRANRTCRWRCHSHLARSEIETATLIGCAGLMADRLVKMLGVEPGFIICPFRGEYFRLAPRHNRIVNHLIYPIPDPAMPFLGVHLTRMIDGSVTVGPNAVLALKREGYRKRDVSFTDTGDFPLRRHSPRTAKPSAFRAGRDEKLAVQKRLFAASTKVLPQPDRQRSPARPAGVRAQAVSPDGKLIDDFLFVTTPRSIHTCNALPGGDISDTYRRAYRQQSSGATRKPEQPRTYAACGTQRGRTTRRIYPLTLQTGSNYAT